jgi:spermidine synthase
VEHLSYTKATRGGASATINTEDNEKSFANVSEVARNSRIKKLGERFQRPSPKAVVLSLHHSPRLLNNIRDLIGILRVLALDEINSVPSVRRSTRSLPALASARRWACCDGARRSRGYSRAQVAPQSAGIRRMSVYFEELDFRPTPMGVLSLRRRRHLATGADIYEIKLGDEFLMSSQFTTAEIELARLGLAALARTDLDVVVGGLGLGYTALAVLENSSVRSLIVVDALAEVIEWHEQGLLPLGKQLTGDPRCRLVNGDFFAMSHSADGFDSRAPGRRFDAVLVDIDHSPRKLLHPRHAALYQRQGLARLAEHLHPGGVFALWSNDPPDDAFNAVMADAFATSAAHVVTFDNSRGDHDASNTVYVGVKADLLIQKANNEAAP